MIDMIWSMGGDDITCLRIGDGIFHFSDYNVLYILCYLHVLVISNHVSLPSCSDGRTLLSAFVFGQCTLCKRYRSLRESTYGNL
jgi:hypothetical protein